VNFFEFIVRRGWGWAFRFHGKQRNSGRSPPWRTPLRMIGTAKSKEPARRRRYEKQGGGDTCGDAKHLKRTMPG
jgi:hypothetical protein